MIWYLNISKYIRIKKHMLTKRKKMNAIKEVEENPANTGSAAAQISILTKKIEELTKHLQKNKHDNSSRRGLIQMVADRRSHLLYLKNNDPKKYTSVSKKLDLKI